MLVAVKRNAGDIVALGVVKRQRPAYAADKAAKAGFGFDKNIHEIGYVAVRESHKGQHLSRQIVQSFLAEVPCRPLFATTSSDRMKATLRYTGFERQGNEWPAPRGNVLSLWIKTVAMGTR
jgi:predicted GNAT family N-acyltransferase